MNKLGIHQKTLFREVIKNNAKLRQLFNDEKIEELDFNKIKVTIIDNFSSEKISEIWEKAIYSNLHLFENNKDELHKYKCILIDEVQDYKYEWLEIIKKYFLDNDGEYVLFGDEKQNIYDRELDIQKFPRTNILGRWNTSLKKTFRIQKKIAKMASEFQKVFLMKYNQDTIQTVEQLELFDDIRLNIEYYESGNDDLSKIAKFIQKYLEDNKIHSNDACLLGTSIPILRNLDFQLRKFAQIQQTTTTFETKEIFNMLIENNTKTAIKKSKSKNIKKSKRDLKTALKESLHKIDLIESESFEENINLENYKIKDKITTKTKLEIDRIRQNKKFNFQLNTGHFKISTIHSFKGWEIPNLFLFLDSTADSFPKHELIYTGITRCKFNLVIISNGSNIYKDFFIKYVDKYEKI